MLQRYTNLGMFRNETLSLLLHTLLLYDVCFTVRYPYLSFGKARSPGVMLNVSFNLYSYISGQTQTLLFLLLQYLKSIHFSQSLYYFLAQEPIISSSTIAITLQLVSSTLTNILIYYSQGNLVIFKI